MQVFITGYEEFKQEERKFTPNIYRLLEFYNDLSEQNKISTEDEIRSLLNEEMRRLKIKKEYEKIEELKWLEKCKLSSTSLRSHLSDKIDQLIFPYGLNAGELITVTGLSGGGKTAFCTMLTSVLISGNNPRLSNEKNYDKCSVLYVSLEQSAEQINSRIISNLSALNDISSSVSYSTLLYGGNIQEKKNADIARNLFGIYSKRLKLLTLEAFNSSPKIDHLLFKIGTILSSIKGKRIVVLDRYENIEGAENIQSSEVARKLKLFAERYHVCIILQAQLNKNSISSATANDGSLDFRKVSGNSLKGTSGLEHNSTQILVLVPEGTLENTEGKEFKKTRIVSVKNRYGAQAHCLMLFDGATNLFLDIEEKMIKQPKKLKKSTKKDNDNSELEEEPK